jgi:large subunit ribosomal protein L30
MVTKAKQRGKAKRKVLAERSRKTRKPAVKVKRPKRRVKRAERAGKDAKVSLFAVIRVRGTVGTIRSVRDTLDMLMLGRKNHCVLVPGNPSYRGMLRKSEECITWGEINQQTLEKLVYKRGKRAPAEGKKPEGAANKDINKSKAGELAKKIMSAGVKEAGVKPVFRLNPPSKGYKSVRKFFPKGDLGYRGEKINGLLKRMI